jgi:exonuclease III
MKILFWNVRGLNDPFKQKEVKKLVRQLNISIICIVETRIREEKAQKIKDFIVPKWGWFHNYDNHCLGRIWICWDPNIVSIQSISIHEQIITCRIISQDKRCWFISVVYGSRKGAERRLLWQEMFGVKDHIGICPWIIGGDFNVVRSLQEKWGGSDLSGYERDFGDCINRLEVEDLTFTWFFSYLV